MTLPDYDAREPIPLPAQGAWAPSVHWLQPEDAVALRAAEACGRPLLIRGRPGTGKSQTARAAAAAAGRPLLSVVIDARTEAQDLMWRFDAVRRLADAQATPHRRGRLKPEAAYVKPEALWWAYAWDGACRWLQRSGQADLPPVACPAKWSAAADRAVLLIDEIDKADPDLPNALLDVLANNGFRMPFGGGQVSCEAAQRPLTIITTNEERELPAAFLRRCLVLRLDLPKEELAFCNRLETVGQQHQDLRLTSEPHARCTVLREAAQRLWATRQALGEDAEHLPGQAEYLDLVAALARLYPAGEQGAALESLDGLFFHKR